MSGKLPDDAFQFYLSLGADRSYEAVAHHYGVTKRAVTKRAANENWQDKLRDARSNADAQAAEGTQLRHMERMRQLREAIEVVMTPPRVQALVASLLKEALKGNVAASRLLMDRLFGRPRNEPVPAVALDLPDGLESAVDIRTAANALVQAVAEGSLAPEDAQRAAAVIESARRSVETAELEVRIQELEQHMKGDGRR